MRNRIPNIATGQPIADGFGQGLAALFQAPLAHAQAAEEAQLLGMKSRLYESQIAENLAKAAQRQREEAEAAKRPALITLGSASRAGVSVPEFEAALSEKTHGAPMMGPPMLSPSIDGVGPSGRTANFDSVISNLYVPAMSTPGDKLNWEQLAKAAGEYQDQDILSQLLQGQRSAPSVGRAVAASKGAKLVDNIGTSGAGYGIHGGEGVTLNQAMLTLFGNEGNSRIAENKAQANSANAAAGSSSATRDWTNARRERTVQGLDKPVTVVDEDTGLASVTTIPTKGEPVVRGVAPPKGNSTEATNAKARNRVIEAVEKDPEFVGADEETIRAEVDKRMARRTGAAAPKPKDDKPAPSPAVPTNNAPGANKASVSAPPASMLKEGVGTQFKNGEVWTLRGGQPTRVR